MASSQLAEPPQPEATIDQPIPTAEADKEVQQEIEKKLKELPKVQLRRKAAAIPKKLVREVREGLSLGHNASMVEDLVEEERWQREFNANRSFSSSSSDGENEVGDDFFRLPDRVATVKLVISKANLGKRIKRVTTFLDHLYDDARGRHSLEEVGDLRRSSSDSEAEALRDLHREPEVPVIMVEDIPEETGEDTDTEGPRNVQGVRVSDGIGGPASVPVINEVLVDDDNAIANIGKRPAPSPTASYISFISQAVSSSDEDEEDRNRSQPRLPGAVPEDGEDLKKHDFAIDETGHLALPSSSSSSRQPFQKPNDQRLSRRLYSRTQRKLHIKDLQKKLSLTRKARKKLRRGLLDEEADIDPFEAALLDAGALEDEPEAYVCDVLLENQRGFMVFGLPKFSPNLLVSQLFFDPGPWTTIQCTEDHAKIVDSPYTPSTYPLPTPAWEWVHSEWLVDMRGDVDEQGWQYASRFHSSTWRGDPDFFRTFVRRRKWVRGRVRRPTKIKSAILGPGTPTGTITPDTDTTSDDEGIGKGEADMGDWKWNPEFSDPQTPGDEATGTSPPHPKRLEFAGDVMGPKSAYSVLPLSKGRIGDLMGWENQLDVRNPFLSWDWVKREGEDWLKKNQIKRNLGSRSDEELQNLWREAVVEINYRRVGRVLKKCKLDRQRLALWKIWLRVADGRTPDADGSDIGKGKGRENENEKGGMRIFSAQVPKSEFEDGSKAEAITIEEQLESAGPLRLPPPPPEYEDVWNLLENRLDALLLMFEYQLTRLSFLSLLLSLHPTTHAHHQYRSHDRENRDVPEELLPTHQHGGTDEMGPGEHGKEKEIWFNGPRMEFWTDVRKLERLYSDRTDADELFEEALETPFKGDLDPFDSREGSRRDGGIAPTEGALGSATVSRMGTDRGSNMIPDNGKGCLLSPPGFSH